VSVTLCPRSHEVSGVVTGCSQNQVTEERSCTCTCMLHVITFKHYVIVSQPNLETAKPHLPMLSRLSSTLEHISTPFPCHSHYIQQDGYQRQRIRDQNHRSRGGHMASTAKVRRRIDPVHYRVSLSPPKSPDPSTNMCPISLVIVSCSSHWVRGHIVELVSG
jgi:hypothetical protein